MGPTPFGRQPIPLSSEPFFKGFGPPRSTKTPQPRPSASGPRSARVEALDEDLVGKGLEEVDLDVVTTALLDHGPEGAAGVGLVAPDDLLHVVLLE